MPHSTPLQKKIIHIDMDAFYASVEQRDHPHIAGKPVIVGGDPKSRGVVCSASYEARRFGVRSAMSSAQAQRLCPQAVFIYPSFEKYKKASDVIRSIFHSITHLVEPLSLDEAYLDVTTNLLNEPLASKIALWIKSEIQSRLHLTASAGVGPNKFIAKLASDFNKPNGLVIIPPEKVFQFIEDLPIEKLWGVGPATTKKLHHYGIFSTADIRKYTVIELENKIGNYGKFLHGLAHGEDSREVDPSFDPKSRGTETTFDKDILNPEQLLKYLESQAEEVALDLKKIERLGKTVTLKIKYADFTRITRSHSLFYPINDAETIFKTASALLYKDTLVSTKPIRLIGISVGNFIPLHEPLQLWFEKFF